MFGSIYGPNGRLPALERENDSLDRELVNALRSARRWRERVNHLEEVIMSGGVQLSEERTKLRAKSKKKSRRK